MSSALLQLKNLTVSFGEEPVINDLSFDLPAGQTLGIVGESGSGKSLTVLSLLGLLPPSAKIISGQAHFLKKDGSTVDLYQMSENRMRSIRGNEIAMIFQEPMTSLNPVFTCGFQVAEALILHEGMTKRQAYDRTLELFDEVKLPRPSSIFQAYPHQISGGQKQRVMIAMALACEPALLLADEPTTALDVTVQKTILDLLLGLKERRGLSLIFISHDLGVIANIADRVAVMYRGQMVENESAKHIFTQPKHPYTQALLACRPPLHQTMDRLPIRESDNSLSPSKVIPDEVLQERWQTLSESKPLIQVKDVCLKFTLSGGNIFSKKKELLALQNISFDIYSGETVGLVGESGSGKTTLGRTILRLLEPSSGDILYEGKSILKYSAREMRALRKEIQIVFQDPYSSLPPHRTIEQILIEPMEVHDLEGTKAGRKTRAEELLHQVGLAPEHLNRYPRAFSGGQRQRICIARALAVRPKFIVCDESVSALDVSVQAQILNLLKDLQQNLGLTYLFISHDLSVIRFVADRIFVLQNGQFVESGNSIALLEKPQKDYTRELIAAVPQIHF